MIHRYWKAFVANFLILVYIGIAATARLLLRDKTELRRFLLALVHRKSRVLLGVLGVQLEVEGRENLKAGENYLIVGNHMSYLDPILLASITPMAFVTSVEMRETFFLGTLTELGACLYVERRSRENIHGEIIEIEQALRAGFHVVVFPEATSTNGEQLRPFKRPLFTAAVREKKSVLPMVIQYEQIDGEKISTRNRDLLCWYGDMPFGSHFLRLMDCRKIRIRVSILPQIPITAESDRDTIMESSYQAIAARYVPIMGETR